MILGVYTPFLTLYLYSCHFIEVACREDEWSDELRVGYSYPRRQSAVIPYADVSNMDYNEGRSLTWNSGVLELVLTALTEKIVNEMQTAERTEERINAAQSRLLTEKLRGIYAYLTEHPALLERRLYVGSRKPTLPPHQRLKRTFDSDIAQPVCPSRTAWRLLRVAKDINDTEVEVFQPERGSNRIKQWFYTVTCNNRAFRSRRECPGCCIGIAHDRYNSSCRQKKTYVMALVRSPKDGTLDWNWIQVNTGCNCAISEKFDF